MSVAYFWDGTRVIEFRKFLSYPLVKEAGLLNMFCVDSVFEDHRNRYGYFPENDGWVHLPIEAFPKEFRMYLLLLGMS